MQLISVDLKCSSSQMIVVAMISIQKLHVVSDRGAFSVCDRTCPVFLPMGLSDCGVLFAFLDQSALFGLLLQTMPLVTISSPEKNPHDPLMCVVVVAVAL